MYSYILKRIFALIPILFIVSIVVFFIIHLTPGDPASFMLGEDATTEEVEKLQQEMGLDAPLYRQYIGWVIGALTGDLGFSYFMNEPVINLIGSHIIPTLEIALIGEIIAIIIGLILGIVSAKKQGSILDQSIMGISLFGMAVPNFILGILLLLFVGVQWGVLPIGGYQPFDAGFWNHFKYLILPAIALGVAQTALMARMTRSSMIEVLTSSYIKTARAKGVKERVITISHALRNAFLPILTIIGQSLGSLVAGAVVTETIFNIPGIGQLVINSVSSRDYTVIQGIVLIVAVSYVLINLLVDILYSVLDPRIYYD